MNRKAVFNIGALIVVVLLLLGVGMYFYDGYTGALITSGDKKCEETENLFVYYTGDLESGQSIFKKGGTKTKVGSAPWSQVIPETCQNGILTERYCLANGDATSESVTCANGCAFGGMTGGKCNSPACSDSDNGKSYQIAGITTGLVLTDWDALGVPPVMQSAKTYSDYCFGSGQVMEYYCYSAGQGNYELRNNTYVCSSLGTGYTCSNGACVAPAPAVEICDGIDNTGNGVKDEGCDDDNDDYCDSAMTRASSYSCVSSLNCCKWGGGDCDDNNNLRNSGYTSDPCTGTSFNIDNDCDGQVDEGCEVCDNLDNNNDGQVDEGCDYDNDDYCVKNMGVIGNPTTCTSGGGDCRDYNAEINPGAEENCFDYEDNDCDFGVNEDCSYTCIDNEPTNDPTIGGTLTLTANSGQSTAVIADSCKNSGITNETICLTASSNNNWNLYSSTDTSCPEGTTCNDPDGPAGVIPGVCS